MYIERLVELSEQAKNGGKFTREEKTYIDVELPKLLKDYPDIDVPRKFKHPAGFSVSGAPVRTFLKSMLLMSGRRALGHRFGGSEFYEKVEYDLAFHIMRSHFHNQYPKGTFCCAKCTLAILPALRMKTIRWFDCEESADSILEVVNEKQWRYSNFKNQNMLDWSLSK